MTYQQLYEQYLEDQTTRGGDEARMDAYVDELNSLGGVYTPSEMYKSWLRVAKLRCEDCERPFKTPAGDVPDVRLDALCQTCKKRREDAEER